MRSVSPDIFESFAQRKLHDIQHRFCTGPVDHTVHNNFIGVVPPWFRRLRSKVKYSVLTTKRRVDLLEQTPSEIGVLDVECRVEYLTNLDSERHRNLIVLKHIGLRAEFTSSSF